MNSDYLALKHLLTQPSYKILEALWFHQISKIEESRDKAAGRGSETAWRYYAGQEKGFKLAMTAAQRALAQMEAQDETVEEDNQYEKLLDELKTKGESK